MQSHQFLFDNHSRELLIRIGESKFDAASAPDFKEQLDRAWKPTVERVTLDLNRVEFIDSSGVGALLGVHKRLPQGAPPIVIRNARPPVVSVLELLRLHRVFNLLT